MRSHCVFSLYYSLSMQALGEGGPSSGPSVRLRLPATQDGGGGRVQSLVVSPAQLAALHSAIIG